MFLMAGRVSKRQKAVKQFQINSYKDLKMAKGGELTGTPTVLLAVRCPSNHLFAKLCRSSLFSASQLSVIRNLMHNCIM